MIKQNTVMGMYRNFQIYIFSSPFVMIEKHGIIEIVYIELFARFHSRKNQIE